MKKVFILIMISTMLLCGCEENKANDVEIKKETTTTQLTTSNISTTTETTTTSTSVITAPTKETTTSSAKTVKSTTKTTKPTTTTTKKKNDKVLPVCSNDDPGFQKFLKEREKHYPNDVVFYSLKEALEYGDYANDLSYGYWYNPKPMISDNTLYEGNNCSRGIYAVELYVPAMTCGENDEYNYNSFKMAATPKNKLIDAYEYVVKNKGWKCEDRLPN